MIENNKIKVNSIWQDANMNSFKVLEIKTLMGKQWVFYKNIKNEKTYSCYSEAFVSRFFEFNNHSYKGK